MIYWWNIFYNSKVKEEWLFTGLCFWDLCIWWIGHLWSTVQLKPSFMNIWFRLSLKICIQAPTSWLGTVYHMLVTMYWDECFSYDIICPFSYPSHIVLCNTLFSWHLYSNLTWLSYTEGVSTYYIKGEWY